jgi:hypothetical protein
LDPGSTVLMSDDRIVRVHAVISAESTSDQRPVLLGRELPVVRRRAGTRLPIVLVTPSPDAAPLALLAEDVAAEVAPLVFFFAVFWA